MHLNMLLCVFNGNSNLLYLLHKRNKWQYIVHARDKNANNRYFCVKFDITHLCVSNLNRTFAYENISLPKVSIARSRKRVLLFRVIRME